MKLWADSFGQSTPVVSDGERYIHSFGTKGKGGGLKGELAVKLPSFTLLGPGAEILIANKDISEADIAPYFSE